MILGDLNACVGRDNTARQDHMRKHGFREMNENRELFADFCLKDLVIGGTIFSHKEIHKTTWTSQDKTLTKSQIDLITINSRWRTSLININVYRGADIGSDNMLGGWKTAVEGKEIAKESVRRKLDLDKLKDPATQREFSLWLQNRFEVLAEMEVQKEDTGVEGILQSVLNIYRGT